MNTTTRTITIESAMKIGLTPQEAESLVAAHRADLAQYDLLSDDPTAQTRRRTPATGIAWLDAMTYDVRESKEFNAGHIYIGGDTYYHPPSGRRLTAKHPSMQRVTYFGGSLATWLINEIVAGATDSASRAVADLRGIARSS